MPRKSALYITRNGLLEPLGQSQVMAYLRGLSTDYAITLITHERPEDWADSARMIAARVECEDSGIRWRPQKFLRKPRIIAPILGMLCMFWQIWREVRVGRADLLHARSYIPAAVAWSVGRLTGTPFIFDMRALWPEELITAGRLRRGSWVHRAIMAVERVCLRDAAAVVSLTEAAVGYLKEAYPRELKSQQIAVIPTCADLDRFTPRSETPAGRVYGCVGTVLSGWFRLDWLAVFYRAAARHDPMALFEVVTRDDPDEVRSALDPDGCLGQRLSIFASPSEYVHENIQRQFASAMFFATGVSKLGSAPTRLGEVLGCGVPVIANAGVGDVAEIVRRFNVGVIADDGSVNAMQAALKNLEVLVADPHLAARCQQAAEDVFSLEKGTEAYRVIYEEILSEDLWRRKHRDDG